MKPLHATVKVQNLPPFVDGAELQRVFQPSPGLIQTQLLGPAAPGQALIHFSDAMTATNCKSLYHGWCGWGPALACEVIASGEPGGLPGGAGPGSKRMREDEPAASSAPMRGFNPFGEWVYRCCLSLSLSDGRTPGRGAGR